MLSIVFILPYYPAAKIKCILKSKKHFSKSVGGDMSSLTGYMTEELYSV
jgi:hypothetical protein